MLQNIPANLYNQTFGYANNNRWNSKRPVARPGWTSNIWILGSWDHESNAQVATPSPAPPKKKNKVHALDLKTNHSLQLDSHW